MNRSYALFLFVLILIWCQKSSAQSLSGPQADYPVKMALDRNDDLRVDTQEISLAPQSLLTLDKDGSGDLDMAEMGGPGPFFGWLRLQTTVRVIDHDGDCVLSAEEIKGSVAQLQRLDTDGNRWLSEREMYDKRSTVGGVVGRQMQGDRREGGAADRPQRRGGFGEQGANRGMGRGVGRGEQQRAGRGMGGGMSGDIEWMLESLLTWPRNTEIILPGEDDRAYDGYTFYTESGIASDVQINSGTYLLDTKGNVVHHWETDRHSPEGASAYLLDNGLLLRQLSPGDWLEMDGYPVGSHGILELTDWDGNVVWEYQRIKPGTHVLHHDCEPLPNGNILVLSYEAVSDKQVQAMGGRVIRTRGASSGVRWFESVLEIKPNLEDGTTEVVWRWDTIHHMVQDQVESASTYGQVTGEFGRFDLNFPNSERQFHFNSIDYNAERDLILLSSLSYGEVYVIDHSTSTQEAASDRGGHYGRGGEVLFRWGNPSAYRAGSRSDRVLQGQHDARWLDGDFPHAGDLMVHNNRAGQLRSPSNRRGPFGLGASYTGLLALKLPLLEERGLAEVRWQYTASPEQSWQAPFMSGATPLPNGNTIVVNSFNKRVFEITAEGETVMNYYLPGPGRAFRVYKLSGEHPALQGRDLSPKWRLFDAEGNE